MTFTIVFVCTANRGRSPLAEAVLRQLAPADVDVSSRGVHAVPDLPPLPYVLDAATARGIDLASYRSRPLDSVTAADLVVGFERVHVAAAVVDGGARRDRVFTLPELARLLERVDAANDPAARVAAATDLRAQQSEAAGMVLDPAGRSRGDVEQIVAEIETLTRRVVRALFV